VADDWMQMDWYDDDEDQELFVYGFKYHITNIYSQVLELFEY